MKKAKLVKEEWRGAFTDDTPADQGMRAAAKDNAVAKVIAALVDGQNAIEDAFENLEIEDEDAEVLTAASQILRKLEIQYGDEEHGITSVVK